MRLGTFHKKKKYYLNKVKLNFLSIFNFGKNKLKPDTKLIRSCLLIHDNQKFGDLIVMSSLYREFCQRGIEISILTTASGREFLESNNNIHQFFIKKSDSLKDTLAVCKKLREKKFDIVLDLFETMPSFSHSLILASCQRSYILGFDSWYKRYYTFYHRHDEDLTLHISTRASEVLGHFFAPPASGFNIDYDIPLPDDIEYKVREFISNDRIVIINPLGAKKICRLTEEQIFTLFSKTRARFPRHRIIFTGLQKDLKNIKLPDIEMLPFNHFMYTIALVKYSHYVISVDTALIHIASAYNTPTLGLYPNARRPSYPSHLIWAPNNARALQVVSPSFTVQDITTECLINSVDKLADMTEK